MVTVHALRSLIGTSVYMEKKKESVSKIAQKKCGTVFNKHKKS
jgi:hypothetical protein